jgi:hypothetical protein
VKSSGKEFFTTEVTERTEKQIKKFSVCSVVKDFGLPMKFATRLRFEHTQPPISGRIIYPRKVGTIPHSTVF